MRRIVTGTTANLEAMKLALSSDRPAVSIRYGVGSLAPNSAILGASALTTVSGSTPGSTSARTVSVGTRSRRQTSGNSCSSVKRANCCSGTIRPLGVGTWREERRSKDTRWSLVARATTVTGDVVTQLGDRGGVLRR